MSRIVFQSSIDPSSSYSLHLFALVRGLRKLGLEPVIRLMNATCGMILPKDIEISFVSGKQPEPIEILLAPLKGQAPTPWKKTIRMFSWESTRIPASEVAMLNQCACCVVPSNFVATVASACGVNVPIVVVPLGVSEEFGYRTAPDISDGFVFACAGNPMSGHRRKGLDRIMRLFQKAFPDEPNVRLNVKTAGGAYPHRDWANDTRITMQLDFTTEQEVAAWLADCHCFINFATGGWELWAHQSMAVGRSVLGCAYGGMADYFNDQNGFVVAHHLVPAGDTWNGLGLWAEPDEESAIEAMRYAFANPLTCEHLGEKARGSVCGLTWENSCNRLAKVIESVQSPPMTSIESESIMDRPFRFIHGLGDCCNAATLFKAVMARTGKPIQVCCEPDKAPIFKAAGCTIVARADREHEWPHPPYNRNPELPWSDNKTAFNSPWPMDEKFWWELSATELRMDGVFEWGKWAERATYPCGWDDQLIVVHSTGETSGKMKNMSQEMLWALFDKLARNNRMLFAISNIGVNSIPKLHALIDRADLLIGIDSGPLHMARMTNTPALGVWFGLHPTAFAIPCPRIHHLCFANHPFVNKYGASEHYAKAGSLRAKEFNLVLAEEVNVDTIVREVEGMLK